MQAKDQKAQKIRKQGLKKVWKNFEGVLYWEGLPYIPEIIKTELINRPHNELLAGHLGIKKTWELVAQKYYWSNLCYDVKAYITGCDICLASKTVKYKPYGDL